MGAYSHAEARLPSGNNKVIIYPAATETIEQLAQKGITNVRNYGSYWLVEATEAQTSELERIYGGRAMVDNDLNRIRLRTLSFDTTEGSPTVPADLRQTAPTGKRLRLIQFGGPVRPQWLQQIQSVGSVEVICYVPNNAYLARLDQTAEDKLRALEASGGPIQWIGPYHPYYKIQPELAGRGQDKEDPLVNLRVMVVPHSETSDTMKAIEKIGAVTYSYTRANQTALFMTVPVSTVTQMAKLPDVIWIEKEYPKKLLDEVQDLVLAGQTNGLGHGPEGASATTGFTNYLDFLYTQVAGNLTNVFQDPNTYPVVDVADTGIDSGTLPGPLADGPPAHPAFHYFGDAANFSRVLYFGPPWIFGDPPTQLGCANVTLNDNAFRHIESMDLVSHGTAVASIIAGYDDGTNILNKPCLQLVSATNTWLLQVGQFNYIQDTNTGLRVNNPPGLIYQCSQLYQSPTPGTSNMTINIPTGYATTCGPATFTNLTFTITTNVCPTNIYVDVLYTAVVTNHLSELRVDDNGNLLGMGVSPFGLLGDDRIWQNYTVDITLTAPFVTPPGYGAVGRGIAFGCTDQKYLIEAGKCITDIPSLMAIAYDANGYGTYGARIQNNSWSDDLGVPPTNGGPYDVDCVSYDVGVRDAVLVGESNNVPGPSALNQEFIVVFACASALGDGGNEAPSGGYPDIFITAPATAKNIISVGVADNPRFVTVDGVTSCAPGDSLEMPSIAAAGPTLDGRFKPEIVAPGYGVYGAVPQVVAVTTQCTIATLYPAYLNIIACTNPPCNGTEAPIYTYLYDCFYGSSYAAPAVSGAIQLLWWYFQNRLTDEFGNPLLQPSPAMAKAYVCNAARYLPIGDPVRTNVLDTLPSTLQGMGELDLGRMFDGLPRVIRDESSPRAISVPLTTTNPAPQQTYFSQTGQSYTLSGQIASNGQPFRVTLAWVDAPGETFASKELVNDLDLSVVIGGATYEGNVFSENVSVPVSKYDSINNMKSVFLNPVNMLNGILAVTSGAPFQITVRATDIAGNGVPNVGEPPPGGSNTLNQDFALVVYNATNQTDVPNLATNNSCSTAMDVTNYPFAFTNTLTSATYHQAFPSPTAGAGGPEEFFRIPLPTPGATIQVNTIGSSFDNVLSVWEVQVVPQTIYIRGECGALTELVSTNLIINSTPSSELSFTADGTNDYFIVVEPHNNGAGGRMVLNVSGSAPITLTPPSVTFSNPVIVGTTSTPVVVTYLNGTAVPVTISGVSITGPGSNDFIIVSQESNCAGNTLGTGGDCAVAVEFAPTTTGMRQANLVFTDNAVGSPRIVPLTGTGTAPAPAVCLSSPSTLVFSNQAVGIASPPQTIVLTNCGSTALTVSNVTVSGSASNDFSVTQTCTSSNIPAGGTCSLEVTFTPLKSGTRLASLVITHSAAGSPTTVALLGAGFAPAPAICLSSGSINFGSVGVGSTGGVQTLTITNCGTALLVISNIAVTAGNTGDFIVVSGTAATVSTGSAYTVSLQFTPTVGGTRSATLSIISSNNTPSPQQVSLSGMGALSQPDAAISKSYSNLKKFVGFGIINTTGAGQDIVQTVHREAATVIAEGKHGVAYYIAVKNDGSGPDQFTVQSVQSSGGSGWTVNYYLGVKPSESVDITAAVQAGTFATSTMEAGAVTGDSTMIRAEVFADKAIVLKQKPPIEAIFTVTFTSVNDPTRQDAVQIAGEAK
jgi:hypothetical protein